MKIEGLGKVNRSPPKHGIERESCSSKELSLHRFQEKEKYFAYSKKTETERLLNPFGDPWASRNKKINRFIPTMTSSCTAFARTKRGAVTDPLYSDPAHPLKASEDYVRYSNYTLSDLHYDETMARLAPQMSDFTAARKLFEEHGLQKVFIGYTVLNFDDNTLFPRNTQLPEWFYMHKPDGSLKLEDRLQFRDGSSLNATGYVFDIRNSCVRDALCEAVCESMETNNVDGVLIDYAVRRYAFGAPTLIYDLPQSWFENFQEYQHRLITQLYHQLTKRSKLLYLNGVMLDSISVTEPKLINLFLKECDGMMWEQPFRWEWRDYDNGNEDYYSRLQAFFDKASFYKKQLLIKTGSYRYHATEDIDPLWTTRFIRTDHGIERHLAMYNTCFFLLFYNRFYSRLLHTHPTELWDIFTSQAFFSFWDIEIGEALGCRIEYSQHVHLREFQNAIVFVNNTLKPVRISPRRTPKSLDSMLPFLTLQPLSGKIWLKPKGWAIGKLSAIRRILRPRRLIKSLIS